jgi:hypothetical protein
MRDPGLVESRTANDLRVKPPHGRQTRVALGLEANGDDSGTANTYTHSSLPIQNGDFRQSQPRDAYGERQEDNQTKGRPNGVIPAARRDTAQLLQVSTSGRPQSLLRARSEFGPRHRGERNAAVVEEDLWRMRHGWEDEYTSNEYLALLNSVSCLVDLELPI